jgi:hypothetical protein
MGLGVLVEGGFDAVFEGRERIGKPVDDGVVRLALGGLADLRCSTNAVMLHVVIGVDEVPRRVVAQ